jgi:hypothetical protein
MSKLYPPPGVNCRRSGYALPPSVDAHSNARRQSIGESSVNQDEKAAGRAPIRAPTSAGSFALRNAAAKAGRLLPLDDVRDRL